ncbi:MAG TPA: hypothetical protein PLB62_16765, partial [Candidatus Sumerlaeota bacterium]|nr:hypothetical protein [Candidatus Sumerlaeota bacterium]
VLCKSQYQNNYGGAILPFRIGETDLEPALEPMNAIFAPPGVTFARTTCFAAGAHKGVYVTNDSSGEIWYYEIAELADEPTTAPLKRIALPSGKASHVYANDERSLLGVRGQNATPEGDAVYFFKISTWYNDIEFLKPKRYVSSACRACEPLLPLDSETEVEVRITDHENGLPMSNPATTVKLKYTITGPEGDYESPETDMTYIADGRYSAVIHPPVPGDIEITVTVTPPGKIHGDSATMRGCVADSSMPLVEGSVYPYNVLIWFNLKDVTGKMKENLKIQVKGAVRWGIAKEYDNKWVYVKLLKDGPDDVEIIRRIYGKDTENEFSVEFDHLAGEVPEDRPLEFEIYAKAEKGTPPDVVKAEGRVLTITGDAKGRPYCVISSLKL